MFAASSRAREGRNFDQQRELRVRPGIVQRSLRLGAAAERMTRVVTRPMYPLRVTRISSRVPRRSLAPLMTDRRLNRLVALPIVRCLALNGHPRPWQVSFTRTWAGDRVTAKSTKRV